MCRYMYVVGYKALMCTGGMIKWRIAHCRSHVCVSDAFDL